MILHGRIGKYKAWEIVIFSLIYRGPLAYGFDRRKRGDHIGWSLFIALRNFIIIEIGYYDIRHEDGIEAKEVEK